MRQESVNLFKSMQSQICTALENVDGKAKFKQDIWQRTDLSGEPGGGGLTRVISNGAVFEKGGVNFSEVHGNMPGEFCKNLIGVNSDLPFYATGTSLVIHPHSPLVPTVHANYRYIELGDFKWFGGGADLTPYYLFEEDAVHFHQVLKANCDKHNTEYYPEFKKNCDKYFHLAHRQETRGIGGIFFDYQGKENPEKLTDLFSLVQDLSRTFVDAYVPIADQRKGLEWTPEQKKFQLVRRGRYVEFNLIYDRGTIFGLKTGGRIESILMSLPAVVNWDYDYQVAPNTEESKLLDILKNPREWL
ncbi:MAG: oxygen-dependent coproporphyrinogen oxidase [Proteobacteria bacterium]|nr:oxygen-dependent coproporphyrinogen oxidase [Pseudomonadota bacterium]